MFRSPTTRLVLDLSIPPRQVAERIVSGMDHVGSLLFTPTWRLKKDFVGNLRDGRLEMRARHGYSNGYTRLVFARIDSAGRWGGETRVTVEFKDVRFVIVLMTLLWYGMLIPSLLYVARVVLHALGSGGAVDWVEAAGGLGGGAFVLATLYAVEIIGRRLGRRDEERMREHLSNLFADVRRPAPGVSISGK